MATLSEGTQVIIGKTAVAANPLMQSRNQVSYNKPAHDILSESLDICKEKYNSNEEISHRMHAWLRENSATKRLIERVIESEKQIRAGEVMTAEEVDEVMAMDLQWLRRYGPGTLYSGSDTHSYMDMHASDMRLLKN